jgi:hypothetical protein
MSWIGHALGKLESWLESYSIEVFASVLPTAWIEEALSVSGRGTQRVRKLPALLTTWLVIAMGVNRNLSIRNVLERMGNIPGVGSLWGKGQAPTSTAVAEARDRVGFGPLRELFERLRMRLLEKYRDHMSWKGLLVLALDGSTMKVPDSPQNCRRFGLPGASRGRAAFPQMRVMFLISVKLRFILGALFAPYRRAEASMARKMLAWIPSDSLVIMDRNFNAWWFLLGLRDLGSHFLVRAKRGMRGTALQVLGPGDRLLEMKIPRYLRKRFSSSPRTVVVREISVRIRGKSFRYFTSLLDASIYPASELVRLYAERWQEETSLDEIKTHQCGATTVNRPVIFRCKTSRRVMQEAYGLVLAYNLVRSLMAEAALEHHVSPLRISFVDSLERIRSATLLMASAPTRLLPSIYADLLFSISQCLVPLRCRQNPRVVCVKMSAYLLKRKNAS